MIYFLFIYTIDYYQYKRILYMLKKAYRKLRQIIRGDNKNRRLRQSKNNRRKLKNEKVISNRIEKTSILQHKTHELMDSNTNYIEKNIDLGKQLNKKMDEYNELFIKLQEKEKELEINPTLQTTTPFVDNRRFPGTATRIWIRQVPAQKGRSGEDQSGPVWNAANLAADVNPTDEDFQWWRVNPYWAY